MAKKKLFFLPRVSQVTGEKTIEMADTQSFTRHLMVLTSGITSGYLPPQGPISSTSNSSTNPGSIVCPDQSLWRDNGPAFDEGVYNRSKKTNRIIKIPQKSEKTAFLVGIVYREYPMQSHLVQYIAPSNTIPYGPIKFQSSIKSVKHNLV